MASAKKETKKEVKVVVKKGDKRQVSSERINKAEASTKRILIEYQEPFYDFFVVYCILPSLFQSTTQEPLWHPQKLL